jgi:hypothetical protein
MTLRNLTVIFTAAVLTVPVHAEDAASDHDLYDSLVQCAAFHMVEAGMTKDGADATAAHLATAEDYRIDARKHATAGQMPDDDIQTKAASYRNILTQGDPMEMAKGWTALESACRELHLIILQPSPTDGDGVR